MDFPITTSDQEHGMAECSNMGTCNRADGICKCVIGFTGESCQRKACGNNNCNDHGLCVSAREFAQMKDPGFGAQTFYSPGYTKRDRTTNTYVHQEDDTNVKVYEDVWDADMLYKCACDPGYEGVECGTKSCPFGDDPMTGNADDPAGLQYDEVQTITCRADSGSFSIQFRGVDVGHFEKETADIYHDDGAADVKAKLEALPALGIGSVDVSIPGGKVCGSNAVTTTVTFRLAHGDVPVMRAETTKLGYFGINDQGLCVRTTTPNKQLSVPSNYKPTKKCPPCADAQLSQKRCDADVAGKGLTPYIAIRTTTQGTKEHLTCCGRGLCDYEGGQGVCVCGDGGGGGGGSSFEFTISDGYGGKPTVTSPRNSADCGHVVMDQFDCPGEMSCSGHGICAGQPTFKCTCAVGWTSSDCSSRTCARHKAWVSLPVEDGVSHQEEECGGMGTCYRSKGFCQCLNGFEGSACERLVCPGEPTCSGHGACRTQSLLAESTVADKGRSDIGLEVADKLDWTYGTDPGNRHTWDASMVQGCHCDPGFTGIDCSERQCPLGEDPRIPGATHEVLSMACEATVGIFSLKFRGFETPSIDFQASAAEVKTALEMLPSIGKVQVVNDRVRVAKLRLESDEYNATLVDEDGNVVGGLDDNGDGIADITWDSILPCITCDKFHKCTKQIPCRRLDTICSFQGENQVTVKFLTDLGDIPPFLPVLKRYASSVINVEIYSHGKGLSVQGTRKSVQCSNRGTCDTDTGQCNCAEGYSSSDGNRGPGDKGDCGYVMPGGRVEFQKPPIG